jgi:hypothetical protein
MRILFVAGNPELERKLDLDREISALQREIDDAPASEPVELKVYTDCRVDELPSIIANVMPDVIHISAHGSRDAIILRDEDERSIELSGRRLATILSAIGIRPTLIVVNACSSAATARDLAQSADFVIGTDAPIGNAAARVMAATLYQWLTRGSSLEAAFIAAREILGAVSADEVSTRLFPEASEAQARKRVLVEPFRIVARLPAIDAALRAGREAPGKDFDPEEVLVNFGVAGAPSGTTQLVLFTDDEDVVRPKGMSEEELKSWIVAKRPVAGELWTKPPYYYSGDMQWYAAVVTGEARIFGAASTTSAALNRYYFEESWRGDLPEASAALVRRVIQGLGDRDGSRRHRTPRSRVPDKVKTG